MKRTVKRFDVGSVRSTEKTSHGFLKAPVYATRSGVFEYKDASGKTIKEMRPEEEVFSAASLASLSSAPITLLHPREMVTSENASKYMKGYLLPEITQDGDKVSGIAIISHQDAIDAIMQGMKEVSCGYSADLEPAPEGSGYDFVQRNIKYNHLAIVDRGRAGPEVALRLDSEDNQLEPFMEEKSMVKVMLAGKEFEVDEALAAAIQSELSAKTEEDKKDKDAAVAAQEAEKQTQMAQADQVQAKLDAANAELAKRNDAATPDVRGLVKARVQLEQVASFLGVEKSDELEDSDLRKAVILKDHAGAKLDEKSAEYIAARFDAVAERVIESADFRKKLGMALVSKDKKDGESNASDARLRMMQRSDAMWKTQGKGK